MLEKKSRKLDKKKNELKKRVLSFSETDFVEQNNKKPIKHKKEKIALVKVIIGAIFLLFIVLAFVRKYTHYITLYTKTISDSTKSSVKNNADYIAYKKGLIRYSSDGVTYIDNHGNIRWSYTYNLNTPSIKVNGDYAMIVDKYGVEAYTYTDTGRVAHISSLHPINRFDISNIGDFIILSKDGEESYVDIYDRVGDKEKRYIKYVQDVDGEPLDASISKDGSKLIVSFCKVQNEKLSSYIKTYDINKESIYERDDRIIETIEDRYDDKIVAYTKFIDENHALACYDGGISFINIAKNKRDIDTTSYDTYTVSIKDVLYDDIIHGISVSGDRIAIVLENSEVGKNPYRLMLYDKSGKNVLKKDFNKDFLNFYINKGLTYFVGIDDMMIIDSLGFIRYDGFLIDNFIYATNNFSFLFIDMITGLESSVKHMILY